MADKSIILEAFREWLATPQRRTLWGMTARSIPLKRIFGQNIRIYRAAKGMSQEDLAEKADIKRTYIGSIERGEVDPRLETVSKVAAGLGVDAFKLLVPVTEQLSLGVDAVLKRSKR
ncbi:helix-turn-helix transcriptional regulator [Steroidobacter flavus]|uniref:Helix-turn-helix transcriptional regulator n=1 Tax=Steroidobacter flavus TaxID=1842136 RepID=A0ABV8SVE4_9GAMM